nr:MAG TPA: hypothetical protein [Bacteriophage sp.]
MPVPYIQEVGNQPGKLAISTLSELWYNEKIQNSKLKVDADENK